MSAAYELFLERQEAEDEAAGRPLGVKLEDLPKRVRVKCANCSRSTIGGAYYCPVCKLHRCRT